MASFAVRIEHRATAPVFFPAVAADDLEAALDVAWATFTDIYGFSAEGLMVLTADEHLDGLPFGEAFGHRAEAA